MKKTNKVGFLATIFLFSLSLCILGGSLSGTSFAAEEDFPKKEVTVIVNFGAGGGRDTVVRGIGEKMSKYLGVPVVVKNLPGAGGARGLIELNNSAPDGYTIGISAAQDILKKIIEKREYDHKNFSFIGRATSDPLFLFVKSDSPFRSVKDFKTFGKPVRISVSSLTSNWVVAMMILANREGFSLAIVGGFKGAADYTLALVRGEVELSGPILGVAQQYVRAGQIRPILTIDENRYPDFPDTPTAAEIGHPDLAVLKFESWFIAPPGVPKARVQILEDALMNTLKDPEFLSWAKGASLNPAPLGSEATTKEVFGLYDLLVKYKGDVEKHIKK